MQFWVKNESDSVIGLRIIGLVTDKMKHLKHGEIMIEDVADQSDIGIVVKSNEIWAITGKAKKSGAPLVLL